MILVNTVYYSTTAPFYHIKNAQNMTHYYTVEQDKNTEGKQSYKMARQNDPNLVAINSVIINTLFDALTYKLRIRCIFYSIKNLISHVRSYSISN